MQKSIRIIFAALFLMIAASLGTAAFLWIKNQNNEEAYGGKFTLIDQNSKPITEAALLGHPSMVFFGFTHCPDVCPTTLFEMKGWLDKLGEDGKNLQGYFVTVDPERDTPEIMGKYVSNVSNRITGITGTLADIGAMAKGWGVYFKKAEGTDGDYEMDHTALVFLLNSKGQFTGTIAVDDKPEDALAKIKRLAKS
jgi:protein SCO1/2